MTIDNGKDLMVTVTVKNGRLWRAIKAQKQYASVAAFCRANCLRYQHVMTLMAMRIRPVLPTGEWSDLAWNLSSAVKMEPEEIWPEYMRGTLKRNEWTVGLDVDEVQRIAAPSSDDAKYITLNGLQFPKDAIQRAIQKLSPIEQDAIERYYFDGETLESYATTRMIDGEIRPVSRERARQILRKSLRKLARPSNVSAMSETPLGYREVKALRRTKGGAV